MRFSKWLLTLFLTVILCAAGFCGFNLITDPFGVFGDHFFQWYSYDLTKNPRAAKITYLDKHYQAYDSYIIGCSKTGGIPIDDLNEVYGANFYSMLMYGGDMYDIETTAQYIIEHYEVKHIVINLGLEEAVSYHTESDSMSGNLSYKVDGSSPLLFYGKYLFANPAYGFAKIESRLQDSYVPRGFDVFNTDNGTYDKRKRDTENIGDLASYREANRDAFVDLSQMNTQSLTAKAQCIAAIEKIKRLCDEKNISFTLILDPVSDDELSTYNRDDLAQYWNGLAEISAFWDFCGYTSISYDDRYFYDTYHYRTSVGKMMLHKIAGNEDTYIPSDFGCYVTTDNVDDRVATAFTPQETTNADTYSTKVPILMYHYIGDSATKDGVTSAENFDAQLAALKKAGYHTVTFDDLIAYVDKGVALPSKPLIITFDDGYENNATAAYPILKKYGFCATINVIVSSVGKDTYKDTGIAITPHFSYEKAEEMVASGVIDIGNHGYDVHQVEAYENGDYRNYAMQKDGESEKEYIDFFRKDYLTAKQDLESHLDQTVDVYAYPDGQYTDLTEILLMEMGTRVTLTVNWDTNIVIKGLPQSLYAMNRYAISNDYNGETLLQLLELEGD